MTSHERVASAMTGTCAARTGASSVASTIRSAISAHREALARAALDDERREDERPRPVGLRPELDDDDRDAVSRRGGDERLVLRARIARDDADESGRVRERRVARDDHGARRGSRAELLRELLGEHAADDDRPGAPRLELVADGEAEALQLPDERPHVRGPHSGPARPSSPRAWMLWSTPISTRFATIDEPPTVTNGSGMPVTGATPMVMPTLTNTWKRNAKTSPPATTTP